MSARARWLRVIGVACVLVGHAAAADTPQIIDALRPHAASRAASAAPAPELALPLAVRFEPNSSRVHPQSGTLLAAVVAALQSPELQHSRFAIEGHADAAGAADTRQRLAQERAEAVRLYLVALGVQPARLRAVGKGALPAPGGDVWVRVVALP